MPRAKEKKDGKSDDYVYSEDEEKELESSCFVTSRLKVDPETGDGICEVCGEPLSSLVEDDRKLKCKTCGMRVGIVVSHFIPRFTRRAFCMKVLFVRLSAIFARQS